MNNKEIGERIMNIREAMGLTREALAEHAHLSGKFLYEIETGKKSFSIDTLKKISKALDVSSDYILFGEPALKHNLSKIIAIINKYDNEQISDLAEILEAVYKLSKKY